ncbi:MAG: transaldolase [Acidobacteria bacterium]|nr:transaldolase [Acidobacteriota bacterium]
MKSTRKLSELGQSIWLDNITRGLLASGTLSEYIRDFSVTGLTSNPSIFDHAIRNSHDYDDDIRQKLKEGKSGEELLFELELEDLREAADLFRPVHDETSGVDGWASLEVSPILADDAAGTIAAAKELFASADRPNVIIKIPGTKAGVTAIEESIFAGVPINVTLLFSKEQYLASAEAYLRGIERRLAAGLRSDVSSVASLFVSRWDVAVAGKVPGTLRDQLGIAVARQTYKAYRELLDSPRWQHIFNAGTRPQRLLWASTGTKDPNASDVLYVEALIAPLTINTLPDTTLKAFADHGQVGPMMPEDGGDCEAVLAKFAEAGIDTEILADQLQKEGAAKFVKAWNDLLGSTMSKGDQLKKAGSSGL